MHDSETSVKARMLKAASTQAKFIVAISVLSNFLALTHTLSVSLQTVNIDLFDALFNVSNVIALLRDERQNAETRFVDVWNDSKALARCAQTELVKPRQASRQRHRANTPADNDEEYYRRACYIPFLDSLIAELESRFTGHCEAVCRLACVIPRFVNKYTYTDLQPAVHLYAQFPAEEILLTAEFHLLQQKWKSGPNSGSLADRVIPCNALDALVACNRELFPNMYTLLFIAAILPVTTSSAERTFFPH